MLDRRGLLLGAAGSAALMGSEACAMNRGQLLTTVLSGKPAAAPVVTYALPNQTNVFAAYSLRQLNSIYTGPLIRIRRASDSVEQDFSAASAGGFVDTAAIATFIGGSTGRISKWYDQGAGVLDIAQSTAGSQPTYTANSYGTNPGITFDGTSNILTKAAAWVTADMTVFTVFKSTVASSTYRELWEIGPAGNTIGIQFQYQDGSAISDWQTNDANLIGHGYDAVQNPRIILTTPAFNDSLNHQHDVLLSGAAANWFKDGSAQTARSSGVGQVPSFSGTLVVGGGTASNFHGGTLAELILFNTSYGARTTLRANQKSAWGTP